MTKIIKKIQLPTSTEPYLLYDSGAVREVIYNDTAKEIQYRIDEDKIIPVISIDQMKSEMGIGTVINFKGVKDTEAEVYEATDAKKGDIYLCKENHKEYIYINDIPGQAGEDNWEILGSDISSDGFVTEEEYDNHGHQVVIPEINIEAESEDEYLTEVTATNKKLDTTEVIGIDEIESVTASHITDIESNDVITYADGINKNNIIGVYSYDDDQGLLVLSNPFTTVTASNVQAEEVISSNVVAAGTTIVATGNLVEATEEDEDVVVAGISSNASKVVVASKVEEQTIMSGQPVSGNLT